MPPDDRTPSEKRNQNKRQPGGWPAGADRRTGRRWRPPVWLIIVIILIILAMAAAIY